MIKEIELKYCGNEDDPQRKVDYMLSLSPLHKEKYLTGIIIPEEDSLQISDYEPLLMRDHIRTELSEIISIAAISLKSSNGDLTEFEPGLDFEQRDKEYNHVSTNPRQVTGSRHNQSNKWGVYRILRFLSYWIDNENQIKSYKNDLCNLDLFFKKKINDETELYDKTIFDKNNSKIKTSLDRIKNNDQAIALIDDMAEYGWKDVFDLIFGSNKVEIFTDTESFRVKSNKWNEYAMIILDLRVDEKDNELDNNILSGNRLLRDIKEKNPEIPVLIITASNKYNNLKDSIDFGANDYWVKESYELGVSSEYNFENSFKLFNSIEKCIQWNREKRPIVEKLNDIYIKLNDENVRIKFDRKRSLIIALLHNSFSHFVEKKSGFSLIDNIYITAFSIFKQINNYYYKLNTDDEDKKRDKIYLELRDPDDYSIVGYTGDRIKIEVSYEIPDFLKKIESYEYVLRLYLIFKSCRINNIDFYNQKGKYDKLKEIRNNLTLTHGIESATFTNVASLLDLQLFILNSLTRVEGNSGQN